MRSLPLDSMLGANRDGDSPLAGSLADLSAAAGVVRRQFLFGNGDEPIPDFGQFVADVPEALRLLVQTTGVIVADEDDMVTGPTTDAHPYTQVPNFMAQDLRSIQED